MSAFASSKKCLLLLTLCIALPSVAAFADSRSIEVSPSFLFFRQTGTATLPAQQIKVESEASVAVALTASATTKTGGPWLSVSPLAATGSAKFNVSVNTTGLSAGEYAGSISIGVAGIPTPLVVGVLLEVISSTPAAIVLRPQELEFSAVAGGSAPPAQTISVTTSAAVTSWTAAATVSSPTGGSWLKVSPATGTTSGTLQVTVDPTGLAKGEYQGKVTVSGGGFSASASVELEVSAAAPSKLVVVPAAIVFNFDSDDNVTVLQRTMSIRNAGSGTLNWTAKAIVDTPSGGTWLSIGTSSGTTPSSVTVSANSSGLSPGTYNGRIMVTSGSDSAEARVYFMIHGPDKPRVVVHPRAIHFAESGTTITPASRNISVTSKQTGLSFTATATTAKGGNWLKVSPTSGAVTTSSFVTASVDGTIAGALAPGVYTGQIEIKTPGASKATHDVFVALRVFGAQEGVELEVEPGGLGFKAILGGANPVAQNVSLEVEGSASTTWTATVSTDTGGPWLSASPASGTGTTQVAVSVKSTGLAIGTYMGTVTFTPAAASGANTVKLRVNLVVAAQAQVDASASSVAPADVNGASLREFFNDPSLSFVSLVNMALNVSVTVTDMNGNAVEGATVTVTSSNGEPDLTLSDDGGGLYSAIFNPLKSGPVVLTATATKGSLFSVSTSISGDLESSSQPATLIFQGGAVSAASFAPSPTPLAAGGLASIFGNNLSAGGGVASTVPLPTTLGNVSVSIGGVPAPLIVADQASGQINLQVPVEMQNVAQADIMVNNGGVFSPPETVQLTPAAPAVFTLSQNGRGPGALLHADYSTVTSSNPARAGEHVMIYATGLGPVLNAVDDGRAAPGADPVAGQVSVMLGGSAAIVEYAGLAPGYVGLYQVNIVVPSGLASGNALLVVSVNGSQSTGQATVAVQ